MVSKEDIIAYAFVICISQKIFYVESCDDAFLSLLSGEFLSTCS